MKTLGLLGGVSWESTAVYYRTLNELTKSTLGPTHSCPLLLYSFDFEPIRQLSFVEDWDGVAQLMCAQARNLESAGADCVLICANTIHIVADTVAAAIDIPVINLIDAIGESAVSKGLARVGVLGTRFTMQGSFYGERLRSNHGLEVLVPSAEAQELVHAAIYDELTQGNFLASTRGMMRNVISQLVAAGAQGIVLGCTELPMLLTEEDAAVPMLDTTDIHCRKAIEFALSSN